MKALIAAMCMAVATAAWAQDPPSDNPMIEGGAWPDIREAIVGDVTLKDGSRLFDLIAPYRANDAAIVPVVIEQKDERLGQITEVKLIIDENPAPLAATIRFGPAMSPLKFETRVRVNQYSNIRAVAETRSGSYMTGRYVKASGGCSAPASRSPEEALAGMGQMKLRLYQPAPEQSRERQEAQIMIRHPSYSGLQRDQVTRLFIGAHFIHELEVYQGEDLLFALEGGISISENPVFRFTYTDNGATELRVHAVDTEGNVFDRLLPKVPPA
jgi:sulfur-oxidizing protein SoxY